MTWSERLGTTGVWAPVSAITPERAGRIESLGYGAIWQGGSPGADLEAAERILEATSSLVVATGIVNIWRADARELADSYHRIVERHPGRLVLGVGSGHREGTPHRTRPLRAMSDFLDVLDEQEVPVGDRVLSALGPRMLQMAATRSGGTHPYLTTPEQTSQARSVLGESLLVAPEQTLVLDTDPESARGAAREFLALYLRLSNYTGNMRRAGFDAADLADGGTDRLIDGIVAWGDAARLGAAVRAHRAAGADHVCVQMLPVAADPIPALAALATDLDLVRANA